MTILQMRVEKFQEVIAQDWEGSIEVLKVKSCCMVTLQSFPIFIVYMSLSLTIYIHIQKYSILEDKIRVLKVNLQSFPIFIVYISLSLYTCKYSILEDKVRVLKVKTFIYAVNVMSFATLVVNIHYINTLSIYICRIEMST